MAKTHDKMGASHEEQLKRINRITGQVRGIGGMIQEQRYCMDILQQIKAVKSALTSIELGIIDGHLNHCVHKAIDKGIESKRLDEAQEVVDEIRELLRRSLK